MLNRISKLSKPTRLNRLAYRVQIALASIGYGDWVPNRLGNHNRLLQFDRIEQRGSSLWLRIDKSPYKWPGKFTVVDLYRHEVLRHLSMVLETPVTFHYEDHRCWYEIQSASPEGKGYEELWNS